MTSPAAADVAAMVPFAGHLGFEVIRCDAGGCIVEVTLRPEHCTAGGTAHGGFLMSLADFTGAAAAWMALPEGARGTTTSDSKTNMVGAAPAGSRLVAVASPVHIGRRTSVWQTRVSVGDKLISLTIQTQMVL